MRFYERLGFRYVYRHDTLRFGRDYVHLRKEL
jgi:hypothetical protein